MGQRNVLCTQQMLDLKSDQGLSYVPNHIFHVGEVGDYPNQSMYPVQSTTGNAVGLDHRFTGHHGRNFLYGNQHNSVQYYHPFSNYGLGGTAVPNIYQPSMLTSSSSRSSSVPLNNGSSSHLPPSSIQRDIGTITDGHVISDSLRSSCKRKDVEVVPGNFYHVNGSTNLCLPSANLSITSEPSHWGEHYKYAMPFIQPENQGVGFCPTTNGSERRVRSGPTSISLPPEPALPHHHNNLLQGNYMGQSAQPSSSAWVEQFGNHFGDGRCLNHNYADQMTYLHGTSMNSGAVEIPNLGMQEYQDPSSNRDSVFVTHHPPPPNFYRHLPPMHSMPVGAYSHHPHTPLPSYLHPLNSMHANNVYPPRVGVDSGSSSVSPFPSVSEQVNTPLHDATPEIFHGNFRFLSEDAAALQIPRFYGFEEITDQHGDMRLDIDEMSYEELLALEEHIGVVNTGLSEESILKNLKLSVRGQQLTCSQLDQSPQLVPEDESCIVCQVEYEENERIGTLDCGHSYHADCIKQWLLVKNLCPICKKPALATDR